jgi:hypothetical protein
MKRIITALLAISVGVAGLAVATAAPAAADDRICRGSIGARTIDDNLRVPRGARCVLKGTVVKGNIIVKNRARLRAENVRVDGNVQSEGHRRVAVVDSKVGGSIQLKQGRSLTVARNVVDGDIQIFSNNAGDEKIRIARNRVDGNLQCKSNTPRPVGGNNRVQGNKEDQCRNL